MHTVDGAFIGAQTVRAADLDADGDLDVFAAASAAGEVAWWENTAGNALAWSRHSIDAAFGGAIFVAAADLDSDGDLDMLAGGVGNDTVAWWENRGGQFALPTTDTAPASITIADVADALAITVTHQGRVGDRALELTALELLFEETAGDPLTTAEANATIEELRIYRDTGSGVFEVASDTLVATVDTLALTAGQQTVSFTDGDANVEVAFAAPVTFFVVLTFPSFPSGPLVSSLRVTHVTEVP
jgi:hypothetical protein